MISFALEVIQWGIIVYLAALVEVQGRQIREEARLLDLIVKDSNPFYVESRR